MTPLAAPSFVPWEAQELATWLTDGKPEVGWRGDARLELRIGVLVADRPGVSPESGRALRKGDVAARRYEVWRNNPDGTEKRIGAWPLDRFHEVLADLIKMDPETPGHKNVLDRIDAANREADARKEREFREIAGPMMEHAMLLAHDTSQPQHTFYGIPGRGPTVVDTLSDDDAA